MFFLQTENGTAGFYGLIGAFILLLILASIALQLWSLYIIWKDRRSEDWKIKWGAIVFVLGIIGVAAFHLVGNKEKEAPKPQGKIIIGAEKTQNSVKAGKETNEIKRI